MRSKDQILLENLYDKIAKYNMDAVDKIAKASGLPAIPNDGYADGGEPYDDDELEAMNSKEQPLDPEMQDMAKIDPYREGEQPEEEQGKNITVDDLIKAGWTFKNAIDPFTGWKEQFKTWHDEKGNRISSDTDSALGIYKHRNDLFSDEELKNSGDMERRWMDSQRGIDPGNVSFK